MNPAIDAKQLTRDLIGYDTINPPGNERPCQEHIARLLEACGFTTRLYEFAPGRANLVARRGGSPKRPPLCLAGHLDTVPLGEAPWQFDPFGGETADGRIYGRGSSDMKSGVASMVAAAAALAGQLDDSPGLVLVMVAGEETGCEGSTYLTGIPGALGRAGAIIVGEPTSNRPIIGHKGAFWLKAVARGKAAHGAMPQEGINAIYIAARGIGRLEQFDFDVPDHPHLGPPTLNVGTIEGGLNTNSVPDQTVFTIDIRTVPHQDHQSLMARLSRELGPDIELNTTTDVEGIWTAPSHPWIEEVYDALTGITGNRPEVETVAYFTDGAILSPAYGRVPTIIMGPGETTLAHQTDEFCRVAKIEQAVEAYTEIARRWCEI